MSQTFFPAEILNCKLIGQKYAELSLKLKASYTHQAGQYCILKISDSDGNFEKPLSIASEPREDHILELCLTVDEFRTKNALDPKNGSKLSVSAAAGSFPVPAAEKNSLFIAGGSGISPLRSMIRSRLQSKSKAKSLLIYGCQNQNEIPYLEEFSDLAQSDKRLQLFLFAEDKAVNGIEKGLVTEALKVETLETFEEFFMCGPQAMMQACKQRLNELGISDEKIFKDRY